MRGLGNYKLPPPRPTIERKIGNLLVYQGSQAVVRFLDGQAYGLPAELMRRLEITPGERFVMEVVRVGRDVVDVRVERAPVTRPALGRMLTPKVQVRDGKKLTTRR